eukprot:5473904-Alexandrium_andersonii.AAC.1
MSPGQLSELIPRVDASVASDPVLRRLCRGAPEHFFLRHLSAACSQRVFRSAWTSRLRAMSRTTIQRASCKVVVM